MYNKHVLFLWGVTVFDQLGSEQTKVKRVKNRSHNERPSFAMGGGGGGRRGFQTSLISP